MEAEIGVMQAQAMENLKPPEARRGNEQNLPWSPQGEHGPAYTFLFYF